MMNFDFDKLYLVNPCKLDDECYVRSVHACDILDNAKIFSSFESAIEDIDYLVATSSIETKTDKKHLRNPVLLEDLSEKIFELDGKVGLVFGREDYGLYNDEIAACDIMLRIPASESYLSLNLSHAVKRIIGRMEKERLFDFFSSLLEEINYPEHKKEKTSVMFRRIMGRAMPSKWEYHTLMGVFSRTLEKIKRIKER